MIAFLNWLNYLFGFSMPFSHIGGYVTSGLAFLVSWYYWKKVRKDTFFLWLRILMIYGFIRAIFSAQSNVGLSTMLGYMSHWFCPFILGYAVSEKAALKRSFYAYYITFVVLIMLSVLAFFGYFKPIFGQFQLVYDGLLKGGRSHIALGAILLTLSMFSLGQAVFNTEHDKLRRIGFGFFSIFLLSSIILTGSRGYYIAAALTLTLVAVVWVFYLKPVKKRFMLLGFVVIATLVYGAYFKVPLIRYRLGEVGARASSVADRVWLYKIAVNEIKTRPVFGYGPGQAVMQRSFFEIIPPEKAYVKEFGHLHSFYLHFAADFGLLGLSLFFVMIFVGLREVWQVFVASDTFVKAMAFGLFFALIGVMLGDTMDTLLRGPGVAMELFWFTGMLLGTRRME
jgi:O-antigen ligase